jgi:hypothetical protein
MKTITVFGNELEDHDNLAVKLVPSLTKQFPQLKFVIQDPTENIEPPKEEWIILDVGIGISEVVIITKLSQLEQVKGSSVHDYDVYMDLRLREKLGQLPNLKIILIPNDGEIKSVLAKVREIISAQR